MSDATDNRFYREPATPGVAGDLRERLVDAVLDVLAEEPIATQQEGSERLADVMLAMVQPELERLTKLTEANGGQARFWADHFAEVEKANRDALGTHHKPGHTVAELIAAVVGDLAEVRADGEILRDDEVAVHGRCNEPLDDGYCDAFLSLGQTRCEHHKDGGDRG